MIREALTGRLALFIGGMVAALACLFVGYLYGHKLGRES